MIEIHAIALGIIVFAIIVMACIVTVLLFDRWALQNERNRWRREYERLNAKVRPAFTEAAENLVPMTLAAHERLEKLRKALETKDAAS